MFGQRQRLRLDNQPQKVVPWHHCVLKTQSCNGTCLDSVNVWDLITSHRKLCLGTTAFSKQSLTPDSVSAWDLMPSHTKLWPGASAFWTLITKYSGSTPVATAFWTLITKHSRSTPVATAFWTVYRQVLNPDYQTQQVNTCGCCILNCLSSSLEPWLPNTAGQHQYCAYCILFPNCLVSSLPPWSPGTTHLLMGRRWTPGGKQRDKTTHLLMRGKMDTRR